MPGASQSSPRSVDAPAWTQEGPGTRDATWEILSAHVNELIILADLSGTIFYASPSCRRLGYAQHELIGGGGVDFVHPDDLERFTANWRALFETSEACGERDREHRIRCKDGSWLWMEGSPSLLPSGDGGVAGIINVFRDISERRSVRDRLVESERRYRMIAENATDMISQTSCADGRLTYLSPSVERITGYSPGELIGARMQDYVHPNDQAAFMASFMNLVSGVQLEGRPILFRGRHKDGSWLWLESNPKLLRDARGIATDIIDVTREVGEQQALKTELREALAQATKLAAAKDEFLANMSHEIRTPLTSVIGFANLLAERQDLDVVAKSQVARIAGAGRALLAVVNDVLDFSKLEAGEMTITPGPAQAHQAARDVVEMFELAATAKTIELRLEGARRTPDWVWLDADRFRQILINLVGNAVKFTDRGEVSVSLDYDAGRLSAEVSDTGPGIAAAAREKLFRRFSQIDSSSTRAKYGAGLGLAICRGLAEAMGGSISVKSRIGQGSTFRLELPAAEASEPAGCGVGLADDPLALDGVRVLVADDNAANRELARAILQPAGVEVTEACGGLEAVELAQRLPVDLILMDLQMPGLDGYGAARAIRREPGPNRDMPILAFSSDTVVLERSAGASLFDGRVEKPLTALRLLDAVRRAVFDIGVEEEGQSRAAS